MATGDRELAFLDLVVLQRIGPDTTVERFGSKINSSYFDGANILGTMRLKGYVEIESAIGASNVTVSESGKMILAMAEEKSKSEIDALDKGILSFISKGTREVDKLSERMNVRSGDLAYHLYKLVKNGYIDYDLRSGKVSVMLTESGFKNAGSAAGSVEAPGDEGIGEELAKGPAALKDLPAKKEGPPDVGGERAKSKTVYYLKKWGKAGIAGLVVAGILLLALIWFFLRS
jgi:hypothetical protein